MFAHFVESFLPDFFTAVELVAFRAVLLFVFLLWLVRAVKHEIKRGL